MSEYDRGVEELRRAGMFDKDSDYDGALGGAVKELLKIFSDQGHSGYSAQMTADIFHRLVKGETLTPLTGEDDEWNDVSDDTKQNNRNSAVFLTNGKAEYIDGRVFVQEDGTSFTNGKHSRVEITFPCYPKTTYIHEGTPEAEPFAHVFEK